MNSRRCDQLTVLRDRGARAPHFARLMMSMGLPPGVDVVDEPTAVPRFATPSGATRTFCALCRPPGRAHGANGDAPASVGGVRGGRVRGEGQLKYSMNGFFLLGSEAVPALTTAVVPGRQSASVAWTVPERAGPLRVVQDEPL